MEVIRENTVIGCATTRFATQVSPEPADRFLASASRPLSKRQRKDALYYARKAGLNLVWAKTSTKKPKARPNGQRPAPQVYFYHPDHLGTATLLTDIYGNPYQLFLNLPFGEEMAAQHAGGAYATRYKFNGKELDPETGYYYYGARYYDPVVSRWVSVDPLAEKYPGLSPYNYTANNPVMLVDPDGKTHYFNKKTGEHIYVDDGFDQNIVLVDDKDWSAVKAAQKTKTFLGFSEFYRKGKVNLSLKESQALIEILTGNREKANPIELRFWAIEYMELGFVKSISFLKKFLLIRKAQKGLNFRSEALLIEHFTKHRGNFIKALNLKNYTIEQYIKDANTVIKEGMYVSELNAYIKYIGGKGNKAKYFFVGLTKDGKNITTFHIRNAKQLRKKVRNLAVPE